MQLTESHRSSGGEQRRYQHHAETLDCEMQFSLYLPPAAETRKVPVLVWLSGLTCDDQNFVTKAGAQRWAAEQGVAILAPDTSPRGPGVADDPDGAYDFGLGAGFYVNATEPPYSSHYRMYDYVVEELPDLLRSSFPMLEDRMAISGHSMGGHGALTIALRNPGRYTSVSAFAPICAPSRCPWGEKALTGYLGADRTSGRRTMPRYSSRKLSGCRCASIRVARTTFWPSSYSRSCCSMLLQRRRIRSTITFTTATTTAISSLPRSSISICRFTPGI